MSFLYDRRSATRGGACDSSQMSSTLFHTFKEEVKEEEFTKEDVEPVDAVPFNEIEEDVTVILNGKIVNAQEILECDILIENGKICKVEKNIEAPEGAQIIDAKDKYIIPGAVSCSSNKIDDTQADGLDAETRGWALSGITTVACLVDQAQADKDKLAKVGDNQLYTNIMLKLKASNLEEEELEGSARDLKVNCVEVCGEDVYGMEDEELVCLMKMLSSKGCALSVDSQQGVWSAGQTAQAPNEDLEELVIRKTCSLALQVNIPVCFMNVKHDEAMDILQGYQEKGLRVYLLKSPTRQDLKSAPSGFSNLIYAPRHPQRTEAESDADCEEWITMLYSELVAKEVTDLSRLVELTSAAPARLLNLYPSKGSIAEGSDADLLVFDPMATKQFSELACRAYNINKDQDGVGNCEYVMIGGRSIVSNSQVRTRCRPGQMVQPTPFAVAEDAKLKNREPLQRLDRPGDSNCESKDSPRGWGDRRKQAVQGEIFDKELGIYQRPLSAHGVRNQQDSTFTIKTFF